jgi:hypothetical protein
MAYPLTHLCVAWQIKKDAQFLLGSISPDAVHHREEFKGDASAMKNIGWAKKITHLCPVSEERWGQVTDNEGWVACVKNFLRQHPDDIFSLGYAAHVLTDIKNNRTIWNDFRKNFPEEAAKGYASEYYNDLRAIDARLFHEFDGVEEMVSLLASATPIEMQGLVTAQEIFALQQSLLHENFKNVPREKNHSYKFVTYDDTLSFIKSSAEFFCEVTK